MANVLFAKFNVNEKIYELYEEKESLNRLQNIIYQRMSTDVELNEVVDKKIVNYKFITLDKDPEKMIVNGRLVAYAPGVHVTYDEEKDDVIETEDDKKAAYVTFSFNIYDEVVGFVIKYNFGRVQFIRRFKELIESMCSEIGEIELVLEKDRRGLESKLSLFKHVQEVVFDIIPPNDDKDDFEKLFGIEPKKLNETGSTKFLFKFRGTAKKGIELTSQYMKNLVFGISLGYGNVRAKGKNRSDEEFSVNSDSDSLFSLPIIDNNKDSIPSIEEKTRAGISRLKQMKLELRRDIEENRNMEVGENKDENSEENRRLK